MAEGVLNNLPSRGLLKCSAGAAVVGKAPKTYVADHSTAPAQVVENDPSNVLVAALIQKRDRERASEKGKRPAEPAAERPAKRAGGANPEAGSSRLEGVPGGGGGGGGAGGGHLSGEELRAKTIPELLDLLRARGLPATRGKKEDLVQRLLCCRPRSTRPG